MALLGGVVAYVLLSSARENGDGILAPLGLALAAGGMGAEGAVAVARAKKHREPPRLALLLATIATFAGGVLTVAATGLDLQDDLGGGWRPVGFVAVLALIIAATAAWLAWHVSAMVPSSEAFSGPGKHAGCPAPSGQQSQP